ncbi:MAG: hypothetical protein ISS49_05310 [Anaerolineae bacterium]|nr:hypothetical protein [Anaerolineae bacterium]
MGVIAIHDQRLVTALRQVARQKQVSVEKAAHTAVYRYVRKAERAKIRAETKAFWAMYPQLLEQYLGQYVAIHEGKVVDNGLDVGTLYQRVHERYDNTPVLLAQVTPEPVRELMFRSPRLEPIAL